MAIHGYFFNAVRTGDVYDRVYNAEDFTSYLDKIIGSGVFPNPSDQLQVMAGSGMEVIVSAGQGWINGHKMINDSDYPLTVDESDVLLNRIDSVIFYADLSTREMGIEIVKGTPATSPTIPDLVRNASRYEMRLATISIPKQTTAITQALISDTRPNTAVCGFVAGLVQQADTETLFVQYETAYRAMAEQMLIWQENQQAAFEQWLATLTEQLMVGAYVKKFEKTVSNPEDNIIVLDMADYVYDSSDVVLVFINGLSADEGTNYTLNDSGEQARVILSLSSGELENKIKVVVFKAVLGTPIQSGSVWAQMEIRDIIAGRSVFTQEEE